MTNLQKIGVAITLVSMLAGIIGPVVCIYGAFAALETSENAGIGPVGDQIRNALFYAIGGLVGLVVGGILFLVGRPKAK